MRLDSTKRVKHKPKDHQRPMGNEKRVPKKEKVFTREGAYAIKIRMERPGGGQCWGPWRWFTRLGAGNAVSGRFSDYWFERELMPAKEAKSIAAELRAFTHMGRRQVKIVTVWREQKRRGE